MVSKLRYSAMAKTAAKEGWPEWATKQLDSLELTVVLSQLTPEHFRLIEEMLDLLEKYPGDRLPSRSTLLRTRDRSPFAQDWRTFYRGQPPYVQAVMLDSIDRVGVVKH